MSRTMVAGLSLAEFAAFNDDQERLGHAAALRAQGDLVNAGLAQAGILHRTAYDNDVAWTVAASVTRDLDRSLESFRRGSHYEKRIEELQNRKVMILRRLAQEGRHPEPDEGFIEQGEGFMKKIDEKIAEYKNMYVVPAPRLEDLCPRVRVAPLLVDRGSRLDRRLACPRPKARAAVRTSSRGGDSGDDDPPWPPRRPGDHAHTLDPVVRDPGFAGGGGVSAGRVLADGHRELLERPGSPATSLPSAATGPRYARPSCWSLASRARSARCRAW